ncbi:urea transporter [Ophiocordyceps camponoti-floridani]|uniref:Urea transporter n=1 Tax=Ophiocordyceps camponoti-floridani TaxID=2030778 RepID=A0A8H4VBF7_9HYPO|nr:urea transporter [Ophiocordyceps camponoti-floridani]
MVVCLSTSALDSLQSAMVSSASNDVFGNRLAPRYVRCLVIVVIVPVIIVALKADSILQIYLVSDLLSAATVPVLCLGLVDEMHWWRGSDVIAGGLGGILSVFVFGYLYFGSAAAGAKLLIFAGTLYAKDWSVFGAFVAAPWEAC